MRRTDEKSYVSLEQHLCSICANKFDVGVLLDRRLGNRLEPTTVTGYGVCPECQKMLDTDYIAIVGADPTKSKVVNGRVDQSEVYRTGRMLFMKRPVAKRMFNLEIAALMFCDDAVIDRIEQLLQEKDAQNDPSTINSEQTASVSQPDRTD